MAIELARAHALPKPWGVVDLHPWSSSLHDGGAIGEIWFERTGIAIGNHPSLNHPSLLLKLLFTSQPLSIQVHPDDAFAHSIGLPRGKSEAWYVLSATPDAQVALGLKQPINPQQLREAVDDGSISDLVVWRAVSPGDVIFVPAGTIHAIGAGLVIAEIQQRGDATFRLFDYGRQRELHIESALAVADLGPANLRVRSNRLSDERTVLISSPHFVFEKIDLPPNSVWCLDVEQETWLLVVNGSGRAGSFDVATADAVFAQSDRVDMHAGATGLVVLVAYAAVGPAPDLLLRRGQSDAVLATTPQDATTPQEMQLPTSRAMEKTQ